MKIVVSKDKKRILFEKYFNEEDRFSAECVGMEIKASHQVVCDIRITRREALLLFVKHCDRNLMSNPHNIEAKKNFLKVVSDLYRQDAIEFMDKYNPYALYEDIGRKLNKYQVETAWATRNWKVNLCAFEQGLGKTVYAGSVSKMFKLNRTLVICPSLVKWNWYMDLTEDWGFNSLGFTVLDRDKTMLAIIQETFVIVNYESIVKFYKHIVSKPVDHIIIDECHAIKNKGTQKFKDVQKLIKQFPNARITLLSGTPIKNRVTDLYALLNIAEHPLGKNFMEFKRRYAKGRQKITGVKNVEDLRLKISNFIVRKKSEEELDLPELMIKRYYFSMNDESTNKYNDLMEEIYNNEVQTAEYEREIVLLKDAIKNGSIPPEEIRGANLELKKLITLQKKGNMSKKGNIMTLNRICSESKIKDIVKLVKEYNKQGDKVIVFSFFKTVLEKLHDEFGNKAVLIDGSVTAIKRRDSINKFKKKEEVSVFLGQSIAAGIGINLVNANIVLFCDLPFTPDLLEQPYKRAHRQGQTKDVQVIYAMIPDSIDDRLYRLIEGKSNDINSTIDHGKKGTIEYGNIEKKLFNSLIQDFEKKKGIKNSVVPKFEKVK